MIKELREKCQPRPEIVQYWMSKYVYRKISIYFTWLFLKLRFSANFVTLLSLIPGIIGFIFLSTGDKHGYLIGSFMMGLFLLIDFCDGEVARYNNDNTMTGLFIELVCHYIVNFFIYFGLTIGLYRNYENNFILYLGFIGLLSVMLYKLKSVISWQVICVENLRLNKRMYYRNPDIEYKTNILKSTSLPKTEDTNTEEEKIDLFQRIKRFIKIISNPACNDSNNINFLMLIACLNYFSPTFSIHNVNISLIYIFFIYCCITCFLFVVAMFFLHIKNESTENLYRRFFIEKSSDLDFFN